MCDYDSIQLKSKILVPILSKIREELQSFSCHFNSGIQNTDGDPQLSFRILLNTRIKIKDEDSPVSPQL